MTRAARLQFTASDDPAQNVQTLRGMVRESVAQGAVSGLGMQALL